MHLHTCQCLLKTCYLIVTFLPCLLLSLASLPSLYFFLCSQDTVHMMSCISNCKVTMSEVRKRKVETEEWASKAGWQVSTKGNKLSEINILNRCCSPDSPENTDNGKQQRTGTGVHNNDEIYRIAPHNVEYHRLMMMIKRIFLQLP